ncbi:hypothetical protein SAMN02745824_0185 [Parasphingorhabdus marina DSM 22363]|uniref:Lipoprotein n=1 Tax=Parasphingorhabdus marina DSM 22363 TaxID=1123272 RepID=A0A1N6CME3_9SPHN|nr:hypothetical protein [Parasphingorhabdus marina]SIN59656.1 hypothetical protein SAMN02745824_0185 [Parasphingorhabdus marina DSM 22363]
MRNNRPAVPASAALIAALLLSSCGKQEAVGDVPSGDELARQADAASQAIRDEAAAAEGAEADAVDSATMTSYVNNLRGFSILVPEKWTVVEADSDDNGNVYNDAESGAKLTVGWTENREDADLQAAITALESGSGEINGENVNEDEYRASGTDGDGNKIAQRIMRKPDGTMISAALTYPEDQAVTLDALAPRILDSLTLQ